MDELLQELIQNVFCGICISTAIAVMGILVAMLIHAFMTECMKAKGDIAETAAILSGLAVIVGGVIGGVLTYMH